MANNLPRRSYVHTPRKNFLKGKNPRERDIWCRTSLLCKTVSCILTVALMTCGVVLPFPAYADDAANDALQVQEQAGQPDSNPTPEVQPEQVVTPEQAAPEQVVSESEPASDNTTPSDEATSSDNTKSEAAVASLEEVKSESNASVSSSAAAPKASETPQTLTANVNDVTITVQADAGVFPEGCTLSVRVLTSNEEQATEAAVDNVREEGKNVARAYSFDIKVLDATGKEVQPDNSKGATRVSFRLNEAADNNLQADVYHVEKKDEATPAEQLTADQLKVEQLRDAQTNAGAATVNAKTTGFSYYTVEFTYNDLQYVLQGDTATPLTDILEAVGLSGDVTAVTSSNPDLFAVSDESGVWVVTAKKAFDTSETLTVTISGIEYEIAVTDDNTLVAASIVGNSKSSVSLAAVTGTNKTGDYISGNATDGGTWWAVLPQGGEMIVDGTTVSLDPGTLVLGSDAGTDTARQVNLSANTPWTSVGTSNIKHVVTVGNIRPTSLANTFADYSKLESFDGSGLDATACTNFNYAFTRCYALTELNVAGWQTKSDATYEGAFRECRALETLNLSGWNLRCNITLETLPKLKSLTLSSTARLSGSYLAAPTWAGERKCAWVSDETPSQWTGSTESLVARYSSVDSIPNGDVTYTWTPDLYGGNLETSTGGYNFHCFWRYFPEAGTFRGNTHEAKTLYLYWDGVSGSSPSINLTEGLYTNYGHPWLRVVSAANIEHVVITGGLQPTSMKGLFANYSNLKSFDGSGADISQCENFNSLFSRCSSLTDVNVAGWQTKSSASYDGTFYSCTSLESLDISGWSIGANQGGTLQDLPKLKSLTLSKTARINTSRITDPTWSAEKCAWVSNEDPYEWFGSTTSLVSRYSSDDTAPDGNVTYTWTPNFYGGNLETASGGYNFNCFWRYFPEAGTFRGNTHAAKTLYLYWDGKPGSSPSVNLTTGLYTNYGYPWLRVVSATNIEHVVMTGGLQPTSMNNLFSTSYSAYSNLKSFDGSEADISKCDNFNGLFAGCPLLTDVNVAGWQTKSTATYGDTFNGCVSLETLDLSGWSIGANQGGTLQNLPKLKTLTLSKTAQITTSRMTDPTWSTKTCAWVSNEDPFEWFGSTTSLVSRYSSALTAPDGNVTYTWTEEVYGGNLETASAGYNFHCFWRYFPEAGTYKGNTHEAKTLYLYWDGSPGSSPSVDLRANLYTNYGYPWNRSAVTRDIEHAVILGGLQPTSMQNLFSTSYNPYAHLKSFDGSGADVSECENYYGLFASCTSLTTLDFSGWETKSSANYSFTFSGCTSLESLDLTGWNIPGNQTATLQTLPKLKTITLDSTMRMNNLYFSAPTWGVGNCAWVSNESPLEWIGNTDALVARHSSADTVPGSTVTYTWTEGVYGGNLQKADGSTNPHCWWRYFPDAGTFMNKSHGAKTLFLFWDGVSKSSPAVSLIESRQPWRSNGVAVGNVENVVVLGDLQPTTMAGAFFRWPNLLTFDGLAMDASECTSFESTFDECSKLNSVAVSGWQTNSSCVYSEMFDYCSSLGTLDITGWNIPSSNNAPRMLRGLTNLKTLKVSKTGKVDGLENPTWSTGQYSWVSDETPDAWIGNTNSLIARYSTSSLAPDGDITYTWTGDVYGGNLLKADNSTNPHCWWRYFPEAGKFMNTSHEEKTLFLYWDGVTSSSPTISLAQDRQPWLQNGVAKGDVVNVVILGGLQPTTMASAFTGYTKLETFAGSGMDASELTSLSCAFDSCSALKTFSASGWKTNKCTAFDETFDYCSSLETLDITGWTTTTNNAPRMLRGLTGLKVLKASGTTTLEGLEEPTWGTGHYAWLSNETPDAWIGSSTALTTRHATSSTIAPKGDVVYTWTSGVYGGNLKYANGTYNPHCWWRFFPSAGTFMNRTYGANTLFLYWDGTEDSSPTVSLDRDIRTWLDGGVASTDVEHVVILNGLKPTSFQRGFQTWDVTHYTNLKSFDGSGADVSECTSFYNLFVCDSVLQSVNLSGWKMKTDANYSDFFYQNYALTELILGPECYIPNPTTPTVYGEAETYWYPTVITAGTETPPGGLTSSELGPLYQTSSEGYGANDYGTVRWKWRKTANVVTFDVLGHGTAPESQDVPPGETASNPGTPTARGYVFDGWYVDAEHSALFDFTTAINSDITIYAKWTPLQFKSAMPVVGVTYNGTAQIPSLVVLDENNNELDPNSEYTTAWENNTNAGNATVTITGVGNYAEATPKQFTFTIEKASATVSADPKEKTYGDDDPSLTATVSGRYGEDVISYTLSRANGESVGEYAITASGDAVQGNYNVTFVPSVLTINKIAITPTVTVEGDGWTYGGSGTLNVSGNTDNGAVTYEYTTAPVIVNSTWSAEVPTGAGSYAVRAVVAPTANYEGATSEPVEFTIAKASITPTVAIEGGGWTYGESGTPGVSGNTENGTVSYEYTTAPVTANSVWSAEVPSTAGDYAVRAVVAPTANYEGATSEPVEFTIAKASITPTVAIEGGGWTYGESGTPGVSGNTENGTVSYEYTTAPVTANSVWSAEVPSTAGDYAVRAVVAPTANYAGATSEPVTFTIEPKAATVTANDKQKAYGAADPEFNATVEGTLGNDTLTYGFTRVEGETVGTYSITPTGEAVQGNYAVTYYSGTLTIVEADMIAVADTKSKPYDGTPLVASAVSSPEGATITYSVKGEGGTWSDWSATAPSITEIGTLTYKAKAVMANYKTVESAEATLTVTRAPVTVAADAKRKTYGDDDPGYSATVTGLAEGDQLEYSFSRTSGENIGAYAITVSGAATQGNYDVTYKSASLTIEPKPVNVYAVAQEKVYGEADPELTFTVGSLVGTDSLSASDVTVTRTSGENVGTYPIAASNAVIRNGSTDVSRNYSITYIGALLTINPKPVTADMITIDKAIRDYTGGTVQSGVVIADSGLEASGVAMTVNDYTLSGASATNRGVHTVTLTGSGNYTGTATATWLIDPVGDMSVAYAGGNQMLVVPDLSSVGGSIVFAGTGTSTPPTHSSAGTYEDAYTVTLNGQTYKGTARVTIEKAPLTVTANNQSITYGESIASGVSNVSVVGLKSNDKLDSVTLTPSTKAATNGTAASVTPVGVKILDASDTVVTSNYEITYVSGSLTIDRKAVTVTPSSATKVFGQRDPELSYTTRGLVEGDTLMGALTRKSASTGASGSMPEGEAVGSYAIMQGTLNNDSNPNYSITFTGSASLTITAKPLSDSDVLMQLAPASVPHDGEVHNAPSATLSWAPWWGAQTLSEGTDYSLSGDMSASEIGNYSLTATAIGDNYSDTKSAGWSITDAAFAVNAVSYSGVYDGRAHGIEVTVQPAEGITATPVIEYKTSADGVYSSEAPKFTDVGTNTVYYRVSVTGGGVVEGSQAVAITKRPVTVVAEAKSKEFGATNPELTYIVSGLAEGESLAGALACDAGNAVGTYAITVGTLASANPNYDVAFTGAQLTVNKASYSPNFNVSGWEYGEIPHVATLSGIPEGVSEALNAAGLEPTVEYKLASADDSTYSTTIPTASGNYVARLSIPETDSYAYAEAAVSFTIEPAALELSLVAPIEDQRAAAGVECTPSLVLKDSAGNVLVEGVDYELSGELKSTSFGTHTVHVSGKGNYSGEFDTTWRVLDADAADPVVEETKTIGDGSLVVMATTSADAAVDVVVESIPMDLVEGLMTEEEIAEVQAGATATVYLEVDKLADDQVVESDLNKADALVDTIAANYDLTLWKRVGNEAATKIHEPNGAINVVLTAPEGDPVPDGYERTYFVVRVHEGVAEILASSKSTTIPFSTDKFSSYFVGYRDVVPGSGDDSGGGSGGNGDNGGGSGANGSDTGGNGSGSNASGGNGTNGSGSNATNGTDAGASAATKGVTSSANGDTLRASTSTTAKTGDTTLPLVFSLIGLVFMSAAVIVYAVRRRQTVEYLGKHFRR